MKTYLNSLSESWNKKRGDYSLLLLLIIIGAVVIIFLFFTIQSWKNKQTLLFTDWVSMAGAIFQFLFVVVGCFVFVQIKISKDVSKTMCQRDALGKSAELAFFFSNKVIPMLEDLDKKIIAKGYKFTEHEFQYFCMDEINNLDKTEQQKYKKDLAFLKSNRDIYGDCIHMFNNFEYIALNFAQGVADEQSVFTALSQVYCRFVRKQCAALSSLRSTKDDLFYQNTLDLYKTWSNRIKLKGLRLLKKGVNEKLAEAIDSCYDVPMLPKGTK